MQYKPQIRHRRSIRLPACDYTDAGAYFITICTHNRELFLLDHLIREIVSHAWHELPRRFPSVRLDQLIIMPNHIHGIIWIVKAESPVGAQHRAWPDDITTQTAASNPQLRPPSNDAAPPRSAIQRRTSSPNHAAPRRFAVEHRPLPTNPADPSRPFAVEPRSIGAIVRAFKSRAAKRINRLRRTPNEPVWQRNYYEHVIRNDDDLARIRQYILDNPAKWTEDAENPANWARDPRRGAA